MITKASEFFRGKGGSEFSGFSQDLRQLSSSLSLLFFLSSSFCGGWETNFTVQLSGLAPRKGNRMLPTKKPFYFSSCKQQGSGWVKYTCTMVLKNQESGRKCWATRSSVCSFARTAFACSTLLLLVRSTALIRSLTHYRACGTEND